MRNLYGKGEIKMKFMIREASVWSNRNEEIEINAIEELKKLDERMVIMDW